MLLFDLCLILSLGTMVMLKCLVHPLWPDLMNAGTRLETKPNSPLRPGAAQIWKYMEQHRQSIWQTSRRIHILIMQIYT